MFRKLLYVIDLRIEETVAAHKASVEHAEGRHGRPWPRERKVVNGLWECPVDIRKRAVPRNSERDLPNRAFGSGYVRGMLADNHFICFAEA